jgi:hypothetical protein
MKRKLLVAYQLLAALSDTATGLLLIAVPAFMLRLMRLNAALDALPFLSYIGVFVLSVGVACLYGGWLALRRGSADKLKVVWLLTAVTRGLVATFVMVEVASAALKPGWLTVAFTDGAFVLIQVVGLARGWLQSVRD